MPEYYKKGVQGFFLSIFLVLCSFFFVQTNQSHIPFKVVFILKFKMAGQLVVVVQKAQDLPNRRKLDKQSPYCVGRIQDQVQRTKVIPRGGQNPKWDDEMRFSLDGVSGNILTFFIYHQLKKEDGLVCKAEIDFTNALTKSSTVGFDNWFPLEYENKPAGKIYLEMTYYPISGAIPVQAPNLMKMSMANTKHFTDFMDDHSDDETGLHNHSDSEDEYVSSNQYTSNNGKASHFRGSLMSKLNVQLPPLPAIDTGSQDSSLSSKEKSKTKTEESDKAAEVTSGGWMNKILGTATAYTSLFTKPADFSHFGDKLNDSLDKLDRELLTGISRQRVSRDTYFNDESSDEEEEEEVRKKENKVKTPKRQSPLKGRQRRPIEVNTSDSESEDEEETFRVGQRVPFRSSANSATTPRTRPTVDEYENELESMRGSFQGKPLPTMPKAKLPKVNSKTNYETKKRYHYDSDDSSDDENKDERASAPATPTHTIPLSRSMFAEETAKNTASRKAIPKTYESPSKATGLSYSQIRKMNESKALANSPIRLR